MSLVKMFKKMNTTHLIMLVAAITLGYAIYNYSSTKHSIMDQMSNNAGTLGNMQYGDGPHQNVGNPTPSAPIGENSGPSEISGLQTTSHGMPGGCSSEQIVDPSELLPKDNNSEWAKLNPIGNGDLQGVNLLKSGHHIGTNTVSSSLRNANLQLRSEPANPQMAVGPWNNTTIAPDGNRLTLEIGSSSSM